jgi:hypothetical protein
MRRLLVALGIVGSLVLVVGALVVVRPWDGDRRSDSRAATKRVAEGEARA